MATSSPIGLTREQEQTFLKLTKIKKYLEIPENLVKVNGYVPLKDEYLLFKGNYDALAPIAAGTIVTSKGATLSKIDLKHIACTAVGLYAVLGRGFCLRADINMQTEAALLNWTEAKLFAVEDGSILNTVTSINKTIHDKLLPMLTFGPYGVVQATLDDGLAKAQAFHDSLGVGGAINASKTASAADVEIMFDKLHDNEVQFKFKMINFKLSDGNFYTGWLAADVEDDLVRHNNVGGTVSTTFQVKDATTNVLRNGLVPNATIKNLKSGRVVKSDLLGVYDHEPNRAGQTEFECSAPGYVTQTRVVKIKRGSTIHLDWLLVPSDPQGGRPVAN
jgi:hypothetical protein